MIALLGATGYTGRLVAAELARRGMPHRRGARNPSLLSDLAPAAGADPFVVDAGDPARLDAFLEGATALITTVGPFMTLGMPVVEAAVRNRVPYVDSTGETPFMTRVYERFGDAPVPVVPACGFDYIPGDLAAAVAAADLSDVAAMTVGYDMTAMAPSRGTARTALAVMSELGDVASGSVDLDFGDGRRHGVRVPWGEDVTVPRRHPGVSVTVGVTAPRAAAVAAAPLSRFARMVAPALDPLVSRLPEGPSPERRRRARFRVVAEARSRGGAQSAVLCEGNDIYGLTARFLVEAATQVGGAGALTPAQALDPVPFLNAVSGDGFSWRRLR